MTVNELILNTLDRDVRHNWDTTTIAAAIDRHPTMISGNLTELVRKGELKRVKRGVYKRVAKTASVPAPETFQGPSNGDLYEFLGTSSSGKLILRQLEAQTLIVGTPLEV